MELQQILKGVKPIKQKPIERGNPFNKELPINAYNFPMSKVTEWHAFGYRTVNGKKVYDWITKRLATGQAFTPDLDRCIKLTHKQIY